MAADRTRQNQNAVVQPLLTGKLIYFICIRTLSLATDSFFSIVIKSRIIIFSM